MDDVTDEILLTTLSATLLVDIISVSLFDIAATGAHILVAGCVVRGTIALLYTDFSC